MSLKNVNEIILDNNRCEDDGMTVETCSCLALI